MSKLLLFILLAVAAYLLLRKRRAAKRPAVARPAVPSPEAMVKCAVCGLNIPASESLQADGRHYCGEEHRQIDARS